MTFKLNMDKLKDEVEHLPKTSGESRDLVWYDWKEGNNLLRLLPPWSEAGDFGKVVKKHKNIPGQQRHVCLRDMFGVQCQICIVIDEIEQTTSADLSTYKPDWNAYLNCVNLEEIDKGVQIIRFPYGLYQRIRRLMANPAIGDITDPMTGVPINIVYNSKATGKDMYQEQLYPVRCPITAKNDPSGHPTQEYDESLQNGILNQMYDFDNIWKMPSKDIMLKIEEAALVLRRMYLGVVVDSPTPVAGNVPPPPPGQTVLPAGWRTAIEQTSGKIYYIRPDGSTSWDKPVVEQTQGQKIAPPPPPMSSVPVPPPSPPIPPGNRLIKEGVQPTPPSSIPPSPQLVTEQPAVPQPPPPESSAGAVPPPPPGHVADQKSDAPKKQPVEVPPKVEKPASAPDCYSTRDDVIAVDPNKCKSCVWDIPCESATSRKDAG